MQKENREVNGDFRGNNKELVTKVLAIIVAVAMLITYFVALSRFSSNKVKDAKEESEALKDTSSETSADETSVDEVVPDKKDYDYYNDFVFKTVEYSNDAVVSGSLAVLDGTSFPNVDAILASVYSMKTGSYSLSGTGLRLGEEAMLNIDLFAGKFCELVPGSGLIIDKAYMSGGTVSSADIDLTTGYSVKFSIFGSKHKYTFESSEFVRLREMAHEYGVILRYPSGKESYTGHEYDPKIYRYVGVAHTYYMNRYNMCLEEYLDKVRTEKVIEFKTDNGNGTPYVVYYVPKDPSGKTQIKVPANAGYKYTISGDGSEGFFVTVKIA